MVSKAELSQSLFWKVYSIWQCNDWYQGSPASHHYWPNQYSAWGTIITVLVHFQPQLIFIISCQFITLTPHNLPRKLKCYLAQKILSWLFLPFHNIESWYRLKPKRTVKCVQDTSLTVHYWQNWKRVFFSCYCHGI